MSTPKIDTHTKQFAFPRAGSERVCVGCHEAANKNLLVRVVDTKGCVESPLIPDLRGSHFGHGAYVHASRACLEKACRSGFSKAFRHSITMNVETLVALLVEASTRRIESLLMGGRRARYVVFGTEQVVESIRFQHAALVVVAVDALAAAKRTEIRSALSEQRAIYFGTKFKLGKIFGQNCIIDGENKRISGVDSSKLIVEHDTNSGVAVCAITNERLAKSVLLTYECVRELNPAKAEA